MNNVRKVRKIGAHQRNSSGAAMSLTDLNVDCLLKIFRLLNVSDLARASHVCHKFMDVAVDAFQYEWKNEAIRLSNNSKQSKLESTAILRYFGCHLRKVQVVFDEFGNDKLLNLIIDRCSSHLTEMDFDNACYRDPDPREGKILSKVNLSRINAKFVNLKALRLKDNINQITERKCIEQHFPALEELSLFGLPFFSRNVARFVKLNPQVKRLFTYHYNGTADAAVSLIKFIDQQLPQLEGLGLDVQFIKFRTGDRQPRLLQGLRQLRIHSWFNATTMQHLPISNERVQELVVRIGSCSDAVVDFVCQHKELTKLTIHLRIDSKFDRRHLSQLKKRLPKLNDVTIVY